jgi:hypothetical protein
MHHLAMRSYAGLHEIVKETIEDCRKTVAHSKQLIGLSKANVLETREIIKEIREKLPSKKPRRRR